MILPIVNPNLTMLDVVAVSFAVWRMQGRRVFTQHDLRATPYVDGQRIVPNSQWIRELLFSDDPLSDVTDQDRQEAQAAMQEMQRIRDAGPMTHLAVPARMAIGTALRGQVTKNVTKHVWVIPRIVHEPELVLSGGRYQEDYDESSQVRVAGRLIPWRIEYNGVKGDYLIDGRFRAQEVVNDEDFPPEWIPVFFRTRYRFLINYDVPIRGIITGIENERGREIIMVQPNHDEIREIMRRGSSDTLGDDLDPWADEDSDD